MAWLPPHPPVSLSQAERDRLAALTIGEPAGLSGWRPPICWPRSADATALENR
jgi:hypothetical protein